MEKNKTRSQSSDQAQAKIDAEDQEYGEYLIRRGNDQRALLYDEYTPFPDE